MKSHARAWSLIALGDLCEVNIGRTPARERREFWGPGHPWLSIADMNQGRELLTTKESITDEAVRKCNLKPAEPGTVLLSFKLSIGKVGVAQLPIYTNEAIAALPIRDTSKLSGEYLYWALQFVDLTTGLDRAAKGLTLNKAKLLGVKIPIPPVADQQYIVGVLNRANALRAKRRAALAQLDTLSQSLFCEFFGDVATNNKGWPICQLQHAVRRGTIVTYGIVQAGEEVPGGVPYIRTGDIAEGEIAIKGLRHTAPQIAAKFSRSRVETGDVVMSIRATVGTTALVPPELSGANLTQGTARIAPGEDVNRAYLLACLRAPGTQQWIKQQVKGATFQEITLSRLRELPLAVPPLPLQQRFASCVAVVEKLKSAQKASLVQLEELFVSLQQRAFQGEL